MSNIKMLKENKKWLEENYDETVSEDAQHLYLEHKGKCIYFHITNSPKAGVLVNEGYHIYCNKPFDSYIKLIISWIVEGKDEKVFLIGNKSYGKTIENKCINVCYFVFLMY